MVNPAWFTRRFTSCFVVTVALLAAGSAGAVPLSLRPSDGNVETRVLKIGDTQHVSIDVIAGEDFSGRLLAFTVSRPSALGAIDPMEEVTAKVSPETLELQPGQTGRVLVTLTSTLQAPSFEAVGFSINAITSAETTSVTLPVRLDPVVEIRLHGSGGTGTAPESWSMPAQASLRKHAPGVTLRFVNYDALDEHVVHGQGAIPHGPTNRPLARSVNGQPGGVYEVRINSQNPVTGTYYCHEHEGGAQGKQIKFNAIQ